MDSDSEKAGQQKQENDKAPANDNKKSINWKRVRFVAAAVTIIEIVSYVLWQEADDFSGVVSVFIHWISKCGGLLGAAVIAHKFAERRTKVWIVYTILCAVMLAIPLKRIHDDAATKQSEQASKAIDWQPPELPKDCKVVHIFVGTDFPLDEPVDFLTNHPVRLVNIAAPADPSHGYGVEIKAYIKNNRLYVQAPLPLGITTNSVPILMNTDMDSKLPPLWDRNFTHNTFEVVDNNLSVMLQVHYKRPDDVIIYGVFYGVFTSGRKFVLALGKGQKTYPLSYTTPRIPGVSRIFKYPSSLHPGELAE